MGLSGHIGQGNDRLVLAPAARRDAVLQLLRSARHTVTLSMFRCDDFSVLDEVAAAVQRAVSVKILITQRARGWKKKLKELTLLLKSLGADVRPYARPVMKYHAKYIVADDGPALVTSLNFTRKCFESTRDFLVFTEDPEVVTGLKVLFEHDCNTPAEVLTGITDRLIVAPDHARERVTERLRSARRNIEILDHRVTDPRILALLREKQGQGVSVRVIGDVRIDGLVAHGRIILIDGTTAIVGSMHLSPPSLDARREVALVVDDAPLVTGLYDYFETLARNEAHILNLWSSTPPELPDQDDDEEDEEDE